MNFNTADLVQFSRKDLAVIPLMAAVCLGSTTAYAIKQTTEISASVQINAQPTFYIQTDGQQYTGLSSQKHPLAVWQIPANFKFNPGSNDRIKSYHLQLRLRWEETGLERTFTGTHVNKNYSLGSRPKKVDKNVSFPLNGNNIESFLVEACNRRADGFKNIGQSNKLIFSREYHVNAKIYASHAIDIQPVPPASFDVSSNGSGHPAKIVCMKAPAPTVDTATNLQTSSGVTDSSLTILKQATLGGACKVNLSSVIKTNLPNTTVKYRFEHSNGNKSDVKTVQTSHTKTAMDAHWYNVPNNPNGNETGSIRIKGVSHSFQSAWKNYSMSCNAPAPAALSLVTKPIVNLDLQPTNNIMHNGMVCPAKVKVTATLSSNQAFGGTGVVTVKQGNLGFASHDVNLSPGITWRYYETFDLKPWNTVNSPVGNAGGSNTWQTQPGSGSATPSQRFEIRYILSTNNQSVVTTPFKTISVKCRAAQIQQHLLPSNNGGLTVAPKPNTASPKLKKLKITPAKKKLLVK